MRALMDDVGVATPSGWRAAPQGRAGRPSSERRDGAHARRVRRGHERAAGLAARPARGPRRPLRGGRRRDHRQGPLPRQRREVRRQRRDRVGAVPGRGARRRAAHRGPHALPRRGRDRPLGALRARLVGHERQRLQHHVERRPHRPQRPPGRRRDRRPDRTGGSFTFPFTDFTGARVGDGCDAAHPCSWNFSAKTSWQTNRAQNAVQAFYYVNRSATTSSRRRSRSPRPTATSTTATGCWSTRTTARPPAAAAAPNNQHVDNAYMDTPPGRQVPDDGHVPVLRRHQQPVPRHQRRRRRCGRVPPSTRTA